MENLSRSKIWTSSDDGELESQKILRSKKSASSWGGARYAPYAFTEQGIYMDFGTDSEKLFHCGASSKDAGNKITTIMQLEDIAGYRALFERLLREGE